MQRTREVGAPSFWSGPSTGRAFGALAFILLGTLVWIGTAQAADQPSPKEIKKTLRQAIMSGDDASLVNVLRKAGTIPGRDATNAVLSTARSLPKDFEDAYWLLLDGVAGFQHGDAFSEMGNYIVRHRKQGISRDLINALRKSKSKYLGRVIRRIMETGSLDMQLMAVDLAPNSKVRRTVDILMPYLKDEHAKEKGGTRQPTELKKRLIMALEALTLQEFGNSVPNWTGWWEINRSRGLKVLREEAENEEATTGLARPIDPIRARQFLGLEKMPEGTVLVIKGPRAKNGFDINYDHIEYTLDRLNIPHDVVEKGRLEEKSFSIKKYSAIFINCTQINEFCQNPDHSAGEYTGNRLHRCQGPGAHDNVQFKMKQDALDKLRKWTELGGYLFTEDWALVEVIEPLWGKYVSSGTPLEDENVRIRPSRGYTAHAFLRGVFVPPPEVDWSYDDYDEDDEDDEEDEEDYDPTIEDDDADDLDKGDGKTGVGEAGEEQIEPIAEPDIDLVRHEWKIDKESPSLNIRSKKVEVLIVSPELGKRTGDDAVALTFAIKKGRVLHVLSHFGKQNSAHNEATLENVLVNFLIEVNVRAQSKR